MAFNVSVNLPLLWRDTQSLTIPGPFTVLRTNYRRSPSSEVDTSEQAGDPPLFFWPQSHGLVVFSVLVLSGAVAFE
jgi:hypothetical protein